MLNKYIFIIALGLVPHLTHSAAQNAPGDVKRAAAAVAAQAPQPAPQAPVVAQPAQRRVPGLLEATGRFGDATAGKASRSFWGWIWDPQYTFTTSMRRFAGAGCFGYSLYELIQYYRHDHHRRHSRTCWQNLGSGLKIGGSFAAGIWLVAEPVRAQA